MSFRLKKGSKPWGLLTVQTKLCLSKPKAQVVAQRHKWQGSSLAYSAVHNLGQLAINLLQQIIADNRPRLHMKNLIFLSVLIGSMGLTACGGGGGGSSVAVNPFQKPTGPHDTDDVRPISFSAVSGNEVLNSVCLPQVPSLEKFNAWADFQASRAPLTDVKYVMARQGEFESSLELYSQNADLARSLGALVFEEKVFNGREGRMQSALNKSIYNVVPTYCRDISCVGEAVFNKTYGARLYYHQTFGLLISEYVDELRLDPFEGDDRLQSVLYAVSTFPTNMLPLSREDFFYGFEDMSANVLIAPFRRGGVLAGTPAGTGSTGAAAINRTSIYWRGDEPPKYGDSSIYLYDRWQNIRDFYERVYVVFHEFMHTFDKGGFHSSSDEWIRISGWKVDESKGQKTVSLVDPSKRCSNYGSSSPAEDFAECGAMYRFAPLHLRALSAEKYLYFKNKVFKGTEFLEPKDCNQLVSNFPGIQ